ncbi:MAG: phage tail tube protein, partial [Bacteroidales bacterium]
MLKEGVVEGNDIMVYMNTSSSGSAPEWKPTLHATSHSVDYSAETKVRKTKDTGKWSKKKVTGNSCTIKVDALRSYDAGVGYSELLKKMKAGEEV